MTDRDSISAYQFHPIADIFPRMSAEEFESLKIDIEGNGLLEPIWIYEGKILDGRHRYTACVETGTEPDFREYNGTDPVGFVVSLNLKRRHLNESQRAMVAANLANMERGDNQHAPIGACSQPQAAELLNVSRRAVQRAAAVKSTGTPSLIAAVQSGDVSVSAAAEVATLPEEEQEEIISRGEKDILAKAKEIRKQRTSERRKERFEKAVELSKNSTPLLGIGRFPLIYCDPPWRYDYSNSDSRVIENQYPTMDISEICSLPVHDISLDDCLLFMWTTSPKLEESFQVLKSWGFNYRTCAVWDKEIAGMGYYFRQQHEILLVATKGNPLTPDPERRVPSVIKQRREGHSEKPECFYDLLESMYPGLPKVEMFSRSKRNGWESWGNQA